MLYNCNTITKQLLCNRYIAIIQLLYNCYTTIIQLLYKCYTTVMLTNAKLIFYVCVCIKSNCYTALVMLKLYSQPFYCYTPCIPTYQVLYVRLYVVEQVARDTLSKQISTCVNMCYTITIKLLYNCSTNTLAATCKHSSTTVIRANKPGKDVQTLQRYLLKFLLFFWAPSATPSPPAHPATHTSIETAVTYVNDW